MKRLLIIAILAVFAINVANAQSPEELRESWKKTITVPTSQDPIVEKLFLAWGKEFPGTFVDIYNTYKKTGTTNNQGLYDYKVDYAPKNGFIEIYGSWTMVSEVDGNFSKGDTITRENILHAVYWNLTNGNKLFGVSIEMDGEIFDDCTVMFYEYNANKGTLTPRADITNKVLGIVGEDTEVFIKLPKEGRDIKYYDYSSNGDKVIKWNGNGF